MARKPQNQDSIPLQPLGKHTLLVEEEEEDEFDEEDLAKPLLQTKKKATAKSKPAAVPVPAQPPAPPAPSAPLPYARRGDSKPPSYSYPSESRIPSWMQINLKDTILALSISATHIRIMIAFFECHNNPPLWWFYVVDSAVPSIVGALILMVAVDHELLYDDDDATRRKHWVFFYISIFCGGLGICWGTFNLIYTYVREQCLSVGLLLLFSSLCAVLAAMLFKVRLFIVKRDD